MRGAKVWRKDGSRQGLSAMENPMVSQEPGPIREFVLHRYWVRQRWPCEAITAEGGNCVSVRRATLVGRNT
jgi:hypothetical protein